MVICSYNKSTKHISNLFYRFVLLALRWQWMCNLFVEHSLSSLEIDDSDQCPNGCLLSLLCKYQLVFAKHFDWLGIVLDQIPPRSRIQKICNPKPINRQPSGRRLEVSMSWIKNEKLFEYYALLETIVVKNLKKKFYFKWKVPDGVKHRRQCQKCNDTKNHSSGYNITWY